jgi:hypothetical protein
MTQGRGQVKAGNKKASVSYVVSEVEDRVPSLKRTAKLLAKEEVPHGETNCY